MAAVLAACFTALAARAGGDEDLLRSATRYGSTPAKRAAKCRCHRTPRTSWRHNAAASSSQRQSSR